MSPAVWKLVMSATILEFKILLASLFYALLKTKQNRV